MEKTPRFNRKPENIGKIKIQKRDLDIINLIWKYRFMSSEQIQALTEGSNQVILRRLQKLYHHGNIDRPISQIVFSNPIIGPQKMVYGLGDKGADLLTEEYGIDRGNITWREKNKEVGERYIQHTLMISEFGACLALGLKDRRDTKLNWVSGDYSEIKHEVFLIDGTRKKRLVIIPDGFFHIEDSGGTMSFFLEADRSTMTNERFLSKMRAYWVWWRQGGQRKSGMENFRVLTITKTIQRMENLIEITKKVDDSQTGSYMFWFTTVNHYSLKKPNSILNRIWRTSILNSKSHSLLE